MRLSPYLRVFTLAVGAALLADSTHHREIDVPSAAATDAVPAKSLASQTGREAEPSFVRGAISGVLSRDSNDPVGLQDAEECQRALPLDLEYKDLLAAWRKRVQRASLVQSALRALREVLTEAGTQSDSGGEPSFFNLDEKDIIKLVLREERERRAAMQRNRDTGEEEAMEIRRELAKWQAAMEPTNAANSTTGIFDTFLAPINVNPGGDDAGMGANDSSPGLAATGTSPASDPPTNAQQPGDWSGIAQAEASTVADSGSGSWPVVGSPNPSAPPLWSHFTSASADGNVSLSGRSIHSFSHTPATATSSPTSATTVASIQSLATPQALSESNNLVQASAAKVVDQQSATGSSYLGPSSSPGQSFSPTLTRIDFATFSLATSDPTNGALTFAVLYSGAGFGGSLIGASSNDVLITDASFESYEFDFSPGISLTPGQTYTLQLVDASGSTLYEFDGGGNPYPGGVEYSSTGVAQTAYDVVFSEGIVAVPEPGSLAQGILGLTVVGLWTRRRRPDYRCAAEELQSR